jgi:hypothetical protein
MIEDDGLKEAKRIMGALVRQRPKPHDEMKIGRLSRKKSTRRDPDERRASSSKPKNA